MSGGFMARQSAHEALTLVMCGGRILDEAFTCALKGLSGRDRAFAAELTLGVLRNHLLLKRLLADYLQKPGRLRDTTMINLSAALYQMIYMRVPDHALINEAVELEKKYNGRPAVVNGVLRNIARNREKTEKTLDNLKHLAHETSAPLKKRIRAISTLYSHPLWLAMRWASRFGADTTLELCRANNLRPPLTLRVNTSKLSRSDVIRELEAIGVSGSTEGRLSPSAVIVGENAPGFSELSENDFIRLNTTPQDEAAQLIGPLLDPLPGQRVLDLCAAPGGKTTHMSELMGTGQGITAVDSSDFRLKRLRENLDRLQIAGVEVIKGDVTDEGFPGSKGREKFDRVLLDAPCSSLGVIRRNPDVRLRRTEKDLETFHKKQLILLRGAFNCLKPGGVLVYSVCSTEPEEGEQAAGELLRSSGDSYIIKDGLNAPEEILTEGFYLRSWPHIHNTDGFYLRSWPHIHNTGGFYLRSWPHIHNTDGFFAVKIGRRSGRL